jgi:hypothetical protein
VGPAKRYTLCVALLALAPGRTARADEPLPALIVTRSPGAQDCPDADALAREVARMNGRPSLDPSARKTASTWLHVEINRGADGFSAVIRAQGRRTGERQLSDTGPSCENLADALALTLAMVLDNSASRVSIEPPPPRAPAWREQATAERPRSLTVSALELDATTAIHVGVLAHAGPLILARGRLWLGTTAVFEAGGVYVFEQAIEHSESAGRLELNLASGFLGSCANLSQVQDGVGLALCAEGYLGRLQGTGTGFTRDQPAQNHLWIAGGLALDLAGRIAGPLEWSVRAAAFLVREQRFNVLVDGRKDSLFQSSPVGLWAGVALRSHFE